MPTMPSPTAYNRSTRVNVGRRRKSLRPNKVIEALPVDDGSQGSTKVKEVFHRARDILWKGTKNQIRAFNITDDLIALLGPKANISSITTARVRQLFLHYRDKQQHALSTINRKMACLSKILKFCHEEQLVKSMPVINFVKEPQGRMRFLTEFEEDLIFSKLKPEHKALAQFLLYTGCRMGEAMNLKWSDICEDRVTVWHTKSGRPRTVPLVSKAKEAVEMVRPLGRPMPFNGRYNAFHDDWSAARRQCGMGQDAEVVPHILRHTCASRLVQGGVDIVRVKEWLGHSSLHVTIRYAHLAPHNLFEVAEALER